MTFSRQPVAEWDRRRALAQRIVDRHTEESCEAAWDQYIAKLSYSAKHYVKMRKSSPEIMAELLEPGELARMMAEP